MFWVKAQEIRDRFLQVNNETMHQTFHMQKTFTGSSTPCNTVCLSVTQHANADYYWSKCYNFRTDHVCLTGRITLHYGLPAGKIN